MRTSPLPTIAVVALLVLAGCTGVPGTGENQPTPEATPEITPEATPETTPKAPPDVSPEEFPKASAINSSVFERHATVMGNTSFTLSTTLNRTDRNAAFSDANFTHWNGTGQMLIEPDDSQYLRHTTGGFAGNGTRYSNGSAEYAHSRENNWTEKQSLFATSPFNESGENYLWNGLLSEDSETVQDTIAINATYERKGVEWFHGTAVMRYEASGVDALPEWVRADTPENETYEDFSATLLLDENGVIRHYKYTFEKTPKHRTQLRYERSYTITDIGTTDVEKPDWVTELQESE